MLATLSDLPPDLPNWWFEYKWDGVRAFYRWDGKTPVLLSRNLLDITPRYPELHPLGPEADAKSFILDGEIVALDEDGHADFKLLQRRMHVSAGRTIQRLTSEVPIHYMIFDLLYLNGRPMFDQPVERRRAKLEELAIAGPNWQLSPAYRGEGRPMLQAARENSLEGIVAKRVESIYEPGRRSPNWLKIKVVQRQEFVVGGWTSQENDPDALGSLQVGYYEPRGKANVLRWAGGVGTGFNTEFRRKLEPLLKQLATTRNPFVDGPEAKRGRYGGGRPRNVKFVEPVLVAEIEYRRWPAGGLLQHSSFKGLRTDKPARSVIREDRACTTP